MKRRDFLHAAAGTTGFLCVRSNAFCFSAEATKTQAAPEFCIDQPFDGALIHERSGAPILGVDTASGAKKLKVQIAGTIPHPSGQIELIDEKHPNQTIPVRREGTKFFAEALLEDVKTEFVASLADPQGRRRTARTRVVWLQDSYPRYRFQVDDNSFFTRDIHQKNYKSIFDSPYLAMFREFRIAS